jgi:hypothetical protein
MITFFGGEIMGCKEEKKKEKNKRRHPPQNDPLWIGCLKI